MRRTLPPIDSSRPWRWCALCMSASALKLRADQMTSHKIYNEPGPRLIGPSFSARFSSCLFVVSSSSLVLLSGSLGALWVSILFPPFLLSLPSPASLWSLGRFGRWQSIHPSRVRGFLRYKLYPGTVEIMKRRSLCIRRNLWNPCWRIVLAAIISPAETSKQQRRRRLDPRVFRVPRSRDLACETLCK